MTDPSPIDVVDRFYAAEHAHMNPESLPGIPDFTDMAATLDPDVVLYRSPDLPWGGEFHGHAGYADRVRQMSAAFDRT